MSVEGGTNKPGWPAPGNVRKLRGKFEEIAKKEAEELVKTKRGEKSVTSRPPTTASIERIKTLGRTAVEMGSGDTILRSSAKAKKELGQGKITKGGSRQSKALGRITQARFQARKEQPSVLKRWPPVTQSSSQVKTSKAESETDKKLRQVSVRVGKLNVEERKRRLNRSLMSEEEFYSACQKSSDELADLFLEMAENPEGQAQVRTQQEKLLKMVQGNTKLEKQIKLQKKVVEGLVKTHSKSELEGGLDRVASSICMSEKYGLSPDDITREARMLGCDEKTAMLKMVRRLTVYLQSEIVDASKQTPSLVKRSEMTGFELSVVRGVDKAFKKQVLGNLPSTVAKLEHQCIAIATKKGVIIEEKVAGTGSFKVATFASDYFSIKRPADRVQFVTAKPHKLATDFSALATLRSKGKEETLSGSGTGVVSREPSLSGSVIIHDDEASPSDTSISHGDDEASPSDTFIFHGDDEASPSDTFIFHGDDEASPSGSVIIHDSPKEPVESKDLEEAVAESPVQDAHRGMAAPPQEPPKKEVPLKELTLEEMKELHKKIEEDLAGSDESSVEKRQALEKQQAELEAFMAKRGKDIIIRAEHKQMSDEEEYLHEIEITRALQGPGVIKMHSVIDVSSGEKIMVQEAAGFHLPKIPGKRDNEQTVVDLLEMFELSESDQLTPTETMKMLDMLEDAFRAVEGLHQKGYIHRDLKEHNILAMGDGHGRLTDFGTVVKQQGDPRKTEITGTPHWMAPEVLSYCDSEKWDNLTEKCDVWSCGMILQSMISGGEVESHPAFWSEKKIRSALKGEVESYLDLVGGPRTSMAVLFKLMSLKSEQYEKYYPEPDRVKDPLNHLIWWSTRLDPEKRPTMSEFCQCFHEIKEQLEEEAKKSGSF